MTPLRLAIIVVVAVIILTIGGCVAFGVGSTSSGSDLDDLLTTPTPTAP